MSKDRTRIEEALQLAVDLRERKNQLIRLAEKEDPEIFTDIKSLDNQLRLVMNDIYNSEDLEPFDILTINQSLRINDIESKSVKLAITDDERSISSLCSFSTQVAAFFIDSDELSTATKLGYRENIDITLVIDNLWVSDGKVIRLWSYDKSDGIGAFDSKFGIEACEL